MIQYKGKFWLDERGVTQAVKQSTQTPLSKCALAVERRGKMITSKGGRLKTDAGRNKKGQFKKQYQSVPSPVGQPPHRQSGTLSNSITWAYTERGTAIVGPTTVAWYGAVHEHSKRFPRPFMRPALDYERPGFSLFFRDMPLSETQAGRRLNNGRGFDRAR